MIKEIKYFEIPGNTEEFMNDLDKFNREGSKYYLEGIKDYILSKVGRKLESNETRGESCLKTYFDENDNLLKIKIFTADGKRRGEIEFETNDDKSGFSDKLMDVSNNPPYLEEVYTFKLFDVNSILKHNSTPEEDITLKFGETSMFFKKIVPLPYDIMMYEHGNFLSICYEFFDMPQRLLYNYGYVFIKQILYDIDGTINCGTDREFDNRGLLTREVHYYGTPWGSISVDRVDEWTYDLNERIVMMKNINVYEGKFQSVRKYEIEKDGKIKRYYSYLYKNKKTMEPLNMEFLPENLIPMDEFDYTYNERGQIIKAIRKNYFPSPTEEGYDIYEYDAQGRLVDAKSYDKNGELETWIIYEYLDDLQVRMVVRDYPNSATYQCWQDMLNQ